MAMQPSALKSKMKETIYNGLKAQFGSSASKGKNYNPVADEQWQKLAEAISGIAADIIMEIVQNAQVLPGIPTAGSPAAQTSVAPGKIM
jgi:tRNA A37 threonylcarbamoyltransferase TsaD